MLTSCKDELPNPHKCSIKDILSSLICQDNDMRRINVELRNFQNEFHREIEKIEYRCAELRKPLCAGDSNEQIVSLTTQITTIDDVNECYTAKIENLKKMRAEIVNSARICVGELNSEKAKFKRFHEKTIDYLKRHAIQSSDPVVIKNCETDICEMHRLYVQEISFIKKCENELRPFLKLCDLPDFGECCCFREYDWVSKGKDLSGVDKIADKIKEIMGPSMIKALAQFHVHQATDIRYFLAEYLINLEQNEEMLREKLNLFKDIE